MLGLKLLHTQLTHWGRVTHICVSNLTIIGSDNGLSPGRRQAITWTNVGILLIGPLGTKFSEMLIEIHTFSFKNPFENVVWKMAAILSRPQCVKGAPGQQPFGFFFSWQDQCPCSNNVPCMTCIALLGDYGSWLHGVHIENIPPNKWR